MMMNQMVGKPRKHRTHDDKVMELIQWFINRQFELAWYDYTYDRLIANYGKDEWLSDFKTTPDNEKIIISEATTKIKNLFKAGKIVCRKEASWLLLQYWLPHENKWTPRPDKEPMWWQPEIMTTTV